jgi:hypothetical protein
VPTKAMQKPALAEASGEALLPLFYTATQVVRAPEHAALGLSAAANYEFAAAANAIPLTAAEFSQAGLHYPIVFSRGASPSPVAVVGLRSGNLFTEQWRAGPGVSGRQRYIPAYVRRYPFIIVEPAPGGDQLLGLDMGSSRIKDVGAAEVEPLFDAAGKPAAIAQSAIAFCRDYHRLYLQTQEFVAALTEHELLTPRSTAIHFADRSRHSVDGFQVIDEAALRALAPDLIADWHRRGWLALATLHLASQQNWSVLVDLQDAADRAGLI